MAQDILDPLAEYQNVYRDRFAKVAAETFDAIAAESGIDENANRDLCRKAAAKSRQAASLQPGIARWRTWRFFLYLAVIAAVIYGIWLYDGAPVGDAGAMDYDILSGIALCAVAVALLLIYIFARVNPRLRALRSQKDSLLSEAAKFKEKAWAVMEPLNRLYDADLQTRMMSKAVPRLEFDPFFTEKRLDDLRRVYGWSDSFNDGRSVLGALSGQINGNPFVFCRTKSMRWGSKTYYGHKTIYWTETVRDSQGRCHTESRSETLTASVTKPIPVYTRDLRLIYGNCAAPDLVFSRTRSGLAGQENSRRFRRERRRLKRKARNLSGQNYAMMTNEEFEVAFDTSDRNDNQQHALLFTPLAQQNLMALMSDTEAGYGDDFDFYKRRMINTIFSEHLCAADVEMDEGRYRDYNFDKARKEFIRISAENFRSIYFALAPLLCIPMYQQIRSAETIYGEEAARRSTFWDHEALANYAGEERFRHPQCVTECILKTRQTRSGAGCSTVAVTAYGYTSAEHLSYVSVFGGDGRFHDVPVYWDEYSEVVGEGQMNIAEDNCAEKFTSQSARLTHIADVLSTGGYSLYRRHIAFK